MEILFERGGQRIGVEIEGESITFFDFSSLQKSPIEGLKLNYEGVIKEHPDLKNNPDWRKIAIIRFKRHIKNLGSEAKRTSYIISEFKKMQYLPLYKQRKGFRPEKIK